MVVGSMDWEWKCVVVGNHGLLVEQFGCGESRIDKGSMWLWEPWFRSGNVWLSRTTGRELRSQ